MRTYTYFLIADHHGNARLRSRKPRPQELSPLECLFTVHLNVPEPVRSELSVVINLPELVGEAAISAEATPIETSVGDEAADGLESGRG